MGSPRLLPLVVTAMLGLGGTVYLLLAGHGARARTIDADGHGTSNGAAGAESIGEEIVAAAQSERVELPQRPTVTAEAQPIAAPDASQSGDGAQIGGSRNHQLEIARYLESFLTAEPDILGWQAFFGALANSAELAPDTMTTDQHGKTQGEFVLPGDDKKIRFEITDKAYQLIMEDEISSADMDHVGFRFSVGWKKNESGNPEKLYGTLQFVARDEYEMAALDGRIVGYVYDITDDEIAFRPMSGKIEGGHYALYVPPKEKNDTLAYGDLMPAYQWLSRLRRIDR